MEKRQPAEPLEENGITPEMIEAGVEAFLCHDGRFDSEGKTVEEIFRVMYRLIPPR